MAGILLLSSTVGIFPDCPFTPEEASRALEEALKDGNPNTRKQAVIALSLAASGEPFLTELESMLADKDVQVRLATIASVVDLEKGSLRRSDNV